jgi:hypothetical protein
MATAQEKHFFHWFLEFPQVFQNGGFDCILGNPPYRGGDKLSNDYGFNFTNYIYSNYTNCGGKSDLVAYFIQRIHNNINNNAFFSIITTNTVNTGDTRTGGLYEIIKTSNINFALPDIIWPGKAGVIVTLFSVTKNQLIKNYYLRNKQVDFISSFLDETDDSYIPKVLFRNKDLVKKGSDILGDGFYINNIQAKEMISNDISNVNVVKIAINGDDLNNSINIDENHNRYIIDFFDLNFEKIIKYKLPFEHLKNNVYEFRQLQKNENVKKYWWRFYSIREDLYNRIKNSTNCFVTAEVSKYLNFTSFPTNYVFNKSTYITTKNSFSFFSEINSTFLKLWIEKYSSSLATTMRFTPTDSFNKFPFLLNDDEYLIKLGNELEILRIEIKKELNIGLTKLYNEFHSRGTSNVKILRLRILHIEIDKRMQFLLNMPTIELKHDFYEVDYLPENDRVRYTIHPEARKEVLKRLLELNHKIHEEEVAAGLWDKKKVVKKEKVIKDKKTKENSNQEKLF